MRYDAIHTVIWLVMIAYWVLKARGNKKTVQRFSPGKRLAVFIALAAVIYTLNRTHGWTQKHVVPDNAAVQAIALVLCAIGVAFAIWARHTLGRNWSGLPTIKQDHELITAGPYRYVRHPIYSGLLLGLFGTLVLANGRMVDVLVFGIVATGLHFKSRIEEGYMLQTFPQSYPAYHRRTKAIIPFVL